MKPEAVCKGLYWWKWISIVQNEYFAAEFTVLERSHHLCLPPSPELVLELRVLPRGHLDPPLEVQTCALLVLVREGPSASHLNLVRLLKQHLIAFPDNWAGRVRDAELLLGCHLILEVVRVWVAPTDLVDDDRLEHRLTAVCLFERVPIV